MLVIITHQHTNQNKEKYKILEAYTQLLILRIAELEKNPNNESSYHEPQSKSEIHEEYQVMFDYLDEEEAVELTIEEEQLVPKNRYAHDKPRSKSPKIPFSKKINLDQESVKRRFVNPNKR